MLGVKLALDGAGTGILAGNLASSQVNYEDEHPMGGGLLWSNRHWLESLRTVKDLERRHDATVICGHDDGDLERLRNLE